MANQIRYKLLKVDGRPMIGVYFSFNKIWNEKMKKVPCAMWQHELKCWLIPDIEENRLTASIPLNITYINNLQVSIILQRIYDKMHFENYAPNTVKKYILLLKHFLHTILKKYKIEEVTQAEIKKYLIGIMHSRDVSEIEINNHINAIKFCYSEVFGMKNFLDNLSRPSTRFLVPKVLNENEIKKLFRALPTLKCKAMLLTALSCDLKINETINLKLLDIDSKQMKIFIQKNKNEMCRYVILSPLVLDVLTVYLSIYKPTPVKYLFEGPQKGFPYSTNRAQIIVKEACAKVGIHKEVSYRCLRDSFSKLLLKNEADIKYFKELLGLLSSNSSE